MTVILSMKTFRQLEEKLGTDAAKEVYELAEIIYQEVEKKTDAKISQHQISLAEDDSKRIKKDDLLFFRKEISALLNSFKEDLLTRTNKNMSKFDRSLTGVKLLLIINLITSLTVLGYLLYPLF